VKIEMKGNNSKFDSEIREKLGKLESSGAESNWALMLGKLMDEGVSDMEDFDAEISNSLQKAAVAVATQQMDWSSFESKLDELEVQEDVSFDRFIKSNLDSITPPLSNNSWVDFYRIYQNYLFVRRNVIASRVLELSYIVMVFLFLGSFDFTTLWETDTQEDIVLEDSNFGNYISSEVFPAEGSLIPISTQDASVVKPPVVINLQESYTSQAIPFEAQLISVNEDNKSDFSIEPISKLVDRSPSLPVDESIMELVIQDDLILALHLDEPISNSEKVFLASVYYGHSAVVKRNLLSTVPNNIVDGQFWSTNYAGIDLAFQRGGFEFSTGINYKKNAPMQQLIRDEIRQAQEISLVGFPINLKFFLLPNNKALRPFLRFGSTSSLVIDTEQENLELVAFTSEQAKNTGSRAPVEQKPDLNDFKQLYLSFDLGVGLEKQLNSGVILFMDADYKHFMNNFRTEFTAPSYYMLDNFSARVGGRWTIGNR